MKRKQIWKRRVFAFLLAFTVICTSGNSAFYSYAEEAVEEKKEEAPKEEKKEEAPKEEKKEEAPKEEKKEEAPKEEKKEEAPKEEGGESGNEGSSEGGESGNEGSSEGNETGNEGSSEGSETGNEGSGEGSESGTEEGGTEELETEETEELETEELETEELETEELETEELETEETEEAVITEYVYEDSQVIVTATLSDAAAIPDEAEFVVERIGEGSSRYKELEAMAAREIGESKEVKNILAYDMRFELEGKEIEPAKGTVSVTVVYKEKEQLLPAEELANEEKSGEAAIETGILHVKDGGEVEQLSGSVNLDGEGKVESAGFETDSFSEIVLFGVNGSKTSGITDATYNGSNGSFELEYILDNFNIFAKDELLSKNHIVGEIMAGGDSQVAHLGGDYASGGDKSRIYRWQVPGYVKGKAAVPGDESILGKPLYKGLVNMPANPTSRIYTDNYMSFKEAFSSIDSQCSALLNDSSAIRVKNGGSLKLTEGSNYIIEAGAWRNAITICNSTGGTFYLEGLPTVITVVGEGEFSFSGVGYGVKNNDWYNQTPINAVVVFPDATKINLQTGGNAVGHLVAPKAEVSVTMGGNYNGSIVAKSLRSTGDTEFHKRHWKGNIKPGKKTISISGKKTWVNLPNELNDTDAAYWDTVRVVVGLYANGKKQDEVEISKGTTVPAAWSYQFSNLPEKDSVGNTITYTVKEEDVYKYNGKDKDDKITDYRVSYDGYNIINTYGEKPETVTVSGTKTWVGDTEAVRPGSIEVTLYEGTGTTKAKVEKDVNGNAITNPVTVKPDVGGNWKYEFTNLAKKDAGKNVIAYSVEETAVTNYTTTYPTNSDAYVLDIVNTYQKEKINLSGKKTWIDYEGSAGGQKTRPESITVILMDGSTEVARKVVKKDDNWEYSFTDLDKYNVRNEEIKYTVQEETVPDGYKVSYSANSIDITNSLKEMDYTFWTVNKIWDDENNNNGVRPNSLQVTLYGATTADDKAAVTQDAEGNLINNPVMLSEANSWSHTFTKLPKADSSGNPIIYFAEEETVDKYKDSVTHGANGTTFTNKYEEKINLSGKKTWIDYEDSAGGQKTRPESITVKLMDGSTEVARKVVKKDDNWEYSFTDLDKYNVRNEEIKYTVQEETVPDGYKVSYSANSIDITNSLKEMDYTFWTVEKVWDDENNNDGVRPNSLQVTLYGATTADDKAAVTQDAEGNPITNPVMLSEANGWSHTFTKLPKVDASGAKIIYSAEEETVDKYKDSVTHGANGTTFTNKYDCVYIDPVIDKVWVGDDGNVTVRPDSIEVRLYADGNLQETITVSASDNWRYKFGPLHKYKNGREIAYTITETAIGGYTALIEGDAVAGWRITNTYEEDDRTTTTTTRRGGGGGTTTTISDGPVPLAGDVLGANRTMQEYALPEGEVLGETRTPGTGDAANPWMWGMVMMFSAAFLAVGAGVEKRKKNK